MPHKLIMEQLELNIPKMSQDELTVWNALRYHKGKENAITQHRLAEHTGISPRHVREIIKYLVENHKLEIASSYDSGGGYYIPVSQKEVDETCDKLYGHALSILKRYSVFKKVDIDKLQTEIFDNDH